MSNGTLTVTVVEAKNLKEEGFTGNCEHFVKIILDSKNAQATTTKKNDLNPKYNEKFTFNITSREQSINIECWDNATLIGVANKPFSSGHEEEWIRMDTNGEVKLTLDFTSA